MTTLYPQAAYAEAVHLALVAAGLAPDSTTASVGDPENRYRQLLITAAWPASHSLLDRRAWPKGMRLVWQHAQGWHVDDPATLLTRTLPVPGEAAPAALVEAVRVIRTTGLYEGEESVPLPGSTAVWDGAKALDRGLADWEDRA